MTADMHPQFHLPLPNDWPVGLRAYSARLATPSLVESWQRVLAEHGMGSGDSAVLICDNRRAHVALMFLLQSAGISAVLAAPECTVPELAGYARQLGACWLLRLDLEAALTVRAQTLDAGAESCGRSVTEPGLYLLTSGSTGQPNLVFRPISTWVDEARRYVEMLDLVATHRVLLAAPMQHAYSQGWIWAAALAQCNLDIHLPTQLGALVEALATNCTHCALTPFVASMLARRRVAGGRPAQLRVVMAGAGPVDQSLDDLFERAFGLRLSRNYGSTESGALFAGVAPQAALSIGRPMPGIRVVGEPGESTPFALEVELEGGRLYSTGDIAQRSTDGYQILGRETSAIRRGERWISSAEIESVMATFPGLAACRVRAVKSGLAGNDHILASVVMARGAVWNEAALRAHCKEHLSRSKVPDHFEQVPVIARSSNGKVRPSKIYQRAPAAVLVEAANAYKRAHLLLALHDAGVMARINGRQDADQLALSCHVHADTLNRVLELAALLGIVEEVAGPVASAEAPYPAEVLALESGMVEGWNGVAGILAVLRNGLLERPSDREPAPGPLVERYRAAMNGEHKQLSRTLAVRRLARRGTDRLRVADVSATGAQYLDKLSRLDRLDATGSRHVAVGSLARPTDGSPLVASATIDELAAGRDEFDVIVLDNAVHCALVVASLAALVEHLDEGGAVVVDDLFLERARADIAVDWLTHGDVFHPTLASIDATFQSLGFTGETLYQLQFPVPHRVSLYTRKSS